MSDSLAVTPVSANYPIVVTVCLSLFGTTVLTWCLATRIKTIDSWRHLSYTRWRIVPLIQSQSNIQVILAVYVDSYFFVASTSILQVGVGLDAHSAACQAGTFMCILFYCSSKIVIYLFLIERVHIVRGGVKTRMQDKLYLFNLCGLVPYCAIVILAIIFRYNALDTTGQCYIGLRRESSFPLLIYDLFINIYLTGQFLLPMLGLYSYKNAQNPRLRLVARRTLVGTVATLCSSIANISAVFALQGHEPAFICLACCTADVSFSAVVLHWVTNVHTDENPTYAPKICLFHSRGATNCCVWRTWAYTRAPMNEESHRSLNGTNAASPPIPTIDPDLKGVGRVEGPSTVVTEITGGPRPSMTDVKPSEGASPKARKLLGWFRRASIEEAELEQMRSTDEEAGGGDQPPRASHSVDTGITVQYDVRRTVEDLRRESSSGEVDCVTCIDIKDHRKDDV